MKKPALALALLALALSSQARGICVLESPAEAEPPANGPVLKGLRIHEWGVFLAGGKASVAGGGGESPTFVQRVEMPPLPEASDDPKKRVECLEPVLHVYAPKPLDLSVSVSFPSGKPLLAWPRCNPEWTRSASGNQPMLSWSVKAGGEGAVQPPKVPDEHWIGLARKVGSDLLRSSDGRDAESFLFYEGKVDYAPQVEVRTQEKGAFGITSPAVPEAWVVQGGEKPLRGIGRALNEIRGLVQVRPEPVTAEALRAEFAKAMTAAGLSDKEAGALLGIWMPHLTKPGTRAVYLLPREEYDRILPVSFDPAPEELVRVGLVVQEIQP